MFRECKTSSSWDEHHHRHDDDQHDSSKHNSLVSTILNNQGTQQQQQGGGGECKFELDAIERPKQMDGGGWRERRQAVTSDSSLHQYQACFLNYDELCVVQEDASVRSSGSKQSQWRRSRSSSSSSFFSVSGVAKILLLHMLISLVVCQKDSKTLYIAGFFPTSRDIPQGSIGRGVLPAVRLALQHVNESPKFFTKYKLDLVWNNTKCDAAYGMKAFFRMLDEEPVKIILFGDACPAVTDPIAKASKFFHLIQLSYADTFTATTANFFRIVPSEGSFNPARVKLLKHFNWSKVGTIYQNLPQYALPHSALLTDLDNAKIDIVASQSLVDELRPEMYLSKFKENDVRIILGNFAEDWSKKIFCQAYKEGIYGRRYQWIITGLYHEQWWRLDDGEAEELGCSEEELIIAIEGYIVTDVLTLSKNARTHNGFETSLYKSEYDRLRQDEYSRYHGYAYDGIWAIALAIENVDKKLKMRNSKLSLENFQYRDPFWADLFREALNETSFDGVTGHVDFDKNERRGIILLQQFQSKKLVDIAQYYMTSDKLVLETNEIDWRGGLVPPVDRSTEVITPSRISLTLFIVISVFAIIGIVIASVFLVMNIKYRNQRYIKMSSPYLNNLIIIGCILTYTSVILLGLNSGLTSETSFKYICAGRAWFLMTGFTLAFGSMFSKTWRVHAIFTDIKLNKKLIKDYKLFMIVGVLVFIDVATLTTWQIIDPFHRATHRGKPEPSPENEDILVIPEMEFCQSRLMTIFLGSIYVYKGLLMIFGIFLAWETRHVSIPALNDSKYIGMSVYNVVIMCIIGVGLSFVLRDQQDAAFVIISIFIIFCSTATLCLVFVPKLIELKRNPNAGDRRVRGTLKPFKTSRRDSEEVEMHTKIKLLTEDNFRFRQRLKEKSYELEALTFRLRALEESVKLVKPSNEIVVEENDLRLMDQCDQRKLSVSDAKLMIKSRRKSSSKLCDENLVLQDENSSSEIIVNDTSIFSLSSEAAQLRVKNESTELNGDSESASSESSSKSSDEMSITRKQSVRSSSTHKANGDVGGRKSKNMSSEGEQLSVTDSDDTSYAKAIKETINSQVISYVESQVVQSQLSSSLHHHAPAHVHAHHHHHHVCQADSASPTPLLPTPPPHSCCHHHHHVLLSPKHSVEPPLPPPPPPPRTVSPMHQVEDEPGQQQMESKLLPEGEEVRFIKTRRTQSFGGFLQHQYDELIPFRLDNEQQQQRQHHQHTQASCQMRAFGCVSVQHTSTSPVRTCSSIGATLNLVHSSTLSGDTTSASYVRLFPYLNRSISIDHNQTLRSGQSCPQVRCDIVEYL